MRLRDVPIGPACTVPEEVAAAWRKMVPQASWFCPERECFVVFLLSVRRHLQGFALVSVGTLDTCLASPREVFRLAILQGASAVIVAHNHPSGDPAPSEADIRITRDLIRAGQLLKIELLDSMIFGRATPDRARDYVSLRETGYFYV
jgi:DNA repair protein RadC